MCAQPTRTWAVSLVMRGWTVQTFHLAASCWKTVNICSLESSVALIVGGSVSSTSVHQRMINCRLFHNSTRVCDSKTLIADTLFSIMSLRTFCNSSFASHFSSLSFSLPLLSICTGRATLGQTAPKPLEPSHAMWVSYLGKRSKG